MTPVNSDTISANTSDSRARRTVALPPSVVAELQKPPAAPAVGAPRSRTGKPLVLPGALRFAAAPGTVKAAPPGPAEAVSAEGN